MLLGWLFGILQVSFPSPPQSDLLWWHKLLTSKGPYRVAIKHTFDYITNVLRKLFWHCGLKVLFLCSWNIIRIITLIQYAHSWIYYTFGIQRFAIIPLLLYFEDLHNTHDTTRAGKASTVSEGTTVYERENAAPRCIKKKFISVG